MKAMLLILAAATAQPLYSQTANVDSKPQPIGNPSRWIGEYDYPAAALADRPEGTVAFSLAVDHRGNVGQCQIRRSSGSATLDNATCTILARKAKFKPAAAAGTGDRTYNGKVRWFAPEPVGSAGAIIASLTRDEEDMANPFSSR